VAKSIDVEGAAATDGFVLSGIRNIAGTEVVGAAVTDEGVAVVEENKVGVAVVCAVEDGRATEVDEGAAVLQVTLLNKSTAAEPW
jgi:hypothetical protein